MTFEAITSIAQAETEAREMITSAESKARQMLIDAEKEGLEAIETARSMAADECVKIENSARETAASKEKIANRNTEDEKTRLYEAAQAKMEEAAGLVIEKIIRG
ncbi:MAG: hypothetical protein J5865_04215 [Lachnospiraceae bacterium]|nr:hypothetical protein [Lachnospiraceae bacterium]